MKPFYACSKLFAIAFLFTLLNCGLQGAPDMPACSGFEGKTSDEALAYLNADRSTLEPACINRALRILGQGVPPKSAMKILLQYLDFETPVPPGFPHTARPGPTDGIYPAAEALANYDRPTIVPDLKKVIRNDEWSSAARVNAASVLLFPIPEPSTISFVAQAGRDAVDLSAGKALKLLAEKMADHCPAEKRDECRQALAAQ